MESEIPQSNNGYCFNIHLKNRTDEKVANVSLFEYNHRENLLVEYSSFYPGYDFILRQLAAFKEYENLKITKIHIHAVHENDEMALSQYGSELRAIYTAINGMSKARIHLLELLYETEQHHKAVVLDFDEPISLTNQLNFEMEYLIPNIELVFTIFYQKSIITQ